MFALPTTIRALRTHRLFRGAWRDLATAGAAAAFVLACSGCAAMVRPPAEPRQPVMVYLIDYGRHAGLLLPRDDGTLIEYAYGEWEWYALNRQEPWDVLRALLVPSPGALGRTSHHPDLNGDWLNGLNFETSYAFAVELAAAVRLRDELDAQWDSRAETALHNPETSLTLVHADESYSACNNCNPVTARWLRALGCEVRGLALWSRWRFPDALPDG